MLARHRHLSGPKHVSDICSKLCRLDRCQGNLRESSRALHTNFDIATVQKIVSEILPASTGVAFSKEARDLLIECCVEFITLISSEANEISEKEAKKTIACDHITKALEQLGFSDYVPAVLEAAAEHKETQKVGIFTPRITDGRNADIIATGPREEAQQIRPEWHVDGGT